MSEEALHITEEALHITEESRSKKAREKGKDTPNRMQSSRE